MRTLIFAVLPLALLANCKAPAESANPDKYFQPEVSNLAGANGAGNSKSQDVKPGDPLSPFNKDGTVRSSFPAGVVQRLNAIMTEAKSTIDGYDLIRRDVDKQVAAAKTDPAMAEKAKAGIAQVEVLHQRAAKAKATLAAEGQALLDSKQYYDTVIFSGMATFVTKVEKELADDLKTMGKGAGK
jgi:hypothetical protein